MVKFTVSTDSTAPYRQYVDENDVIRQSDFYGRRKGDADRLDVYLSAHVTLRQLRAGG
ncbi:MAG: hypothetical protein ACLRTQ_11660 [Candidatus Borkfalkia sp.]